MSHAIQMTWLWHFTQQKLNSTVWFIPRVCPRIHPVWLSTSNIKVQWPMSFLSGKLINTKGQLISKANLKVFILTKKRIKYFCISALASKNQKKSGRNKRIGLIWCYYHNEILICISLIWPSIEALEEYSFKKHINPLHFFLFVYDVTSLFWRQRARWGKFEQKDLKTVFTSF